MKNYLSETTRTGCVWAAVLLLAAGCGSEREVRWQGYLEGEFVYVASPLAGRLEKLAVQRGEQVTPGTLLFALERDAELATQRQAEEQLRAAEARVADLRKGSRPSEVAALDARLEQARAAAELAQREHERLEALHRTKVVSDHDYDRARLAHEQAVRLMDELTAQLATARLGARPDAITGAEAEVSAARAARERADWSVSQKAQQAPARALVYDTLYRVGEFVAAGAPVIALLPPENLKVRFFVPEADFAALRAGTIVLVSMTGQTEPRRARVVYLSPKPEYTPPVLYNRENRAKLVFMVEAVFENEAPELHPGLPVDVKLEAVRGSEKTVAEKQGGGRRPDGQSDAMAIGTIPST